MLEGAVVWVGGGNGGQTRVRVECGWGSSVGGGLVVGGGGGRGLVEGWVYAKRDLPQTSNLCVTFRIALRL